MFRMLASLFLVLASQMAAAEISLQDRVAIAEHIAHYGHTFDRRDGDGFAKLFHEQGTWNAYPNKSPTAIIVLKGREEIARFANDRQQKFKDLGIETKHFMLDIVISEEGGNVIKASAMALILWQRPTAGDPLPRPVQSGYYDFYLSKDAEGWGFDRVDVLTSGVYNPSEVYSDIKAKQAGQP
jgi:hypothetical protein